MHRLSAPAHKALDGAGGLVAAGRWHSLRRPVFYAASSIALSVLERLVHLEIEAGDLPPDQWLISLELDDACIEAAAGVAFDDIAATQAHGDAWLASARSVALAVPSAVIPEEHNLVVNPAHPQFSRCCKATADKAYPLDERLFKLQGPADKP
ncbi:RES family NAD+ phosphorylase [Natronocella acetinitrilica]|uniref:RES family NAD+ phosphorylase n=1 Tax=Natronocella acetinitrilica TaxID=414046 RepID=UPI0020A17919